MRKVLWNLPGECPPLELRPLFDLMSAAAQSGRVQNYRDEKCLSIPNQVIRYIIDSSRILTLNIRSHLHARAAGRQKSPKRASFIMVCILVW